MNTSYLPVKSTSYGEGEMARLIQHFDWSSTSLGSPCQWSQSLHITLRVMLNTAFPMFLFWGEDLICFYNDAFRPSLGVDGKHPAIGKKGREVWAEIWDFIGPLIEKVMSSGEPVWYEDQLVPFYRNGHIETIYWTFSYSPAFNDNGAITGVVVTCNETTKQVTNSQKIKALNEELATRNKELSISNEALIQAQANLLQVNARLMESEERFRTMAEASDVLIAVSDESSNAVYFNKAWERLTGRSMDDLIQFGWADLVHPEDRNHYVQIYLSAFEKKTPFTGEFRVPDKTGHYRWLLAQGSPRFRIDGSFAGYISSCVDLTERKEDEQRKNDFIGMVSHELKTPLTSLGGFLQMLQQKTQKINDTFITTILGRAGLQVKRMTTMINGFLNVSRLESGKMVIEKQAFVLNELIRDIIAEMTFTHPDYTITFNACQPILIQADLDKIASVISNLLSNAIKYSPVHKEVHVECKTTAHAALMSVRDNGIGIKPEDISKIFERYYRVPSDRQIAGFGIGLYLSYEIIQRHGGEIWVESEVGKGSTFFFSLPL